MSVTWPEQYALSSSTHVPNNILPALIYRDVLPVPVNPELSKHLCEGNGWEKRAAPRWRNNHCEGDEPMDALCLEISNVPIPDSDPVFGTNGPLCQIWKSARSRTRVKI
ncbi:hypothetical protein IG631_16792 [Alternaria alternata]|nr:hypothetical protein IG631_16792 [Alternaria alternata]